MNMIIIPTIMMINDHWSLMMQESCNMIETTGTADDVCGLNPRVSLSGLHVTEIPRHCLWTGRRLGWSWRLVMLDLSCFVLWKFLSVPKETNRISSSKLSWVYVHVIVILMMIMMTIAMTIMIEKPNCSFSSPLRSLSMWWRGKAGVLRHLPRTKHLWRF